MPHTAVVHFPFPPQALAMGHRALQLMGPRIQIELSVPEPIAAALVAEGRDVPPPVRGSALLDTGASNTCIDEAAAQALGLNMVDQITVRTPAGESQQRVYPVKLSFPGSGTPGLPDIPLQPVAGAALSNQGITALLGRDFFIGKMLHYDGAMSIITLSW